jgi:hypothetical protein
MPRVSLDSLHALEEENNCVPSRSLSARYGASFGAVFKENVFAKLVREALLEGQSV